MESCVDIVIEIRLTKLSIMLHSSKNFRNNMAFVTACYPLQVGPKKKFLSILFKMLAQVKQNFEFKF